MTFTVTYRAKDGALREERVDAANRAECVAVCRKRGIAPTGIRDGKPGKSGSSGKSGVSGKSGKLWFAVGAALVIAAGGAWWWFGRDGARPSQAEAPAKPKAVKPAKPQPKPKAAVAKPSVPAPAKQAKPKEKWHPPQTPEERLAWIEKVYGNNIPDNLKSEVYFLKNPPTATFKPPPRPEDVFKHPSEKTIAAVMLMKPGVFVMQRTVYDESFDEDFKRAMAEPTVVEEGDSDETKELKAAVAEMKADFAARMANGEKPSEIMNKAMNEAYELGKFSGEVQAMLNEWVDDPSRSNEDVKDFVSAANKLLKEKGLDEIAVPELLGRQVRLRRKLKEQSESGNGNGNESSR